MSPLQISEIQYDDIPEIVRFDRDSFYPDEHPYMDAMYPNRYTEVGLHSIVERWQASFPKLQNKPSLKVLKVTDTETGAIVASGRWSLPCSAADLDNHLLKPVIRGPYWPNEDDRAWTEYLADRYTQRRRQALHSANGQMFALTHLAVHPNHQRLGAGSLFVRWGTEQADMLGLECCVESSLRAEQFYAGHEFVAVERCSFPPSGDEVRWKDKAVQEYVWMIRPARRVLTGT